MQEELKIIETSKSTDILIFKRLFDIFLCTFIAVQHPTP